MKRSDERLGKDLRAAAGRDLPGEEFDRRVMQTIEGGGGERIVSVDPGVSRWRGVRLAAAAILLTLGVWAVASGQFRREEALDTAAAGSTLPADIELPRAENTDAWPGPIRISVNPDGKLRIMDRPTDLDGLREVLTVETEGTHDASRPSKLSERHVVLLADRRVRWRMVQWVLQACADPEIRLYRIHFAMAGEDGGFRVMSVFLPIDRGLGLAPTPLIEDEIGIEGDEGRPIHIVPLVEGEAQRIKVELRREAGQKKTRCVYNGEAIESRDECRRRLDLIHKAGYAGDLEINASADVPWEDVVFFLDAYRRCGKGDITFVGAPPPKRR